MSTSWPARKKRLSVLLKSATSDAEEGLALDRLLHGQWAIGKTSKTSEIELVRFSHNDLILIGTLEFGQFSVVDVVKCKLDAKLYIRKSIEKRFAYRTRDQCNPQIERDILLRAKLQGACWAPHILCAFQTETHVNLIMTYAEGGTLWDVLESSPLDGRITEHDLRWWLPQVISALSWCHDQGFVHRDVKPHNFVLTASSHIQLIDFACAAPLLTPEPDGSRLVPRQFCLVLCGTCDYISPEILQAHEAALVALEMSDDVEKDSIGDTGLPADLKGYGLETDWWSMGVMVYEMVYGVTPFFANDVRTTYTKIMDHKRSLHFEETSSVSATLREFIERCLTAPVQRLGRCSVQDIQAHSFFKDVPWQDLNQRTPPADLHLPLFSYSNEVTQIYSSARDSARESSASSSSSSEFHMSPFFDIAQSNPLESPNQRGASREYSPRSIMVDQTSDYFIGFSWGPAADAFLMSPQPPSPATSQRFNSSILATKLGIHETPCFSVAPALAAEPPFATPSRPVLQTPHPGFSTLPRTSTVRRTARRRAVSDREAMRQLVDCVGMSARKKILAAGRTPRTIARTTKEKNIRFLPSRIETGLSSLRYAIALNSDTSSNGEERASPHGWKQDDLIPTEDESGSTPPSPSPSPRPGSAMSMLSRRSATPTMAIWPTAPSSGYGSQSHRRSTSPLGDPHTPSRHSLERQGQDSSRFSQQLSHLASDLQAQHVPKTDDIQIVRHPLPNRKDPTAMSEVPEDAEPSLAVSLTTDGLRDLEYRYESLVAEIMRLDQCIAQRAHS